MLSRRYLRIRVMQTLYAWYQTENKNTFQVEQVLFKGTDRIYDLYLQLLSFFMEMSEQEEIYYAAVQASAVTGKKKTAVRHLKDNIFIAWLLQSNPLKDMIAKKKLTWQTDTEVLQKAFFRLRQSAIYKTYSSSAHIDTAMDLQFVRDLYKMLLQKDELVSHILEEKNIYWSEGLIVVHDMIFKTIESHQNNRFTLLPLYRDEDDDVEFMKQLINNTIRDNDYLEQLISGKTQNWDADRIALVDIILMKMALCEIINLSSIPVKVSINEYIDISKDYSTHNSKGFINGVIDKIVIELRTDGKINKTGRGLLQETARGKEKN